MSATYIPRPADECPADVCPADVLRQADAMMRSAQPTFTCHFWVEGRAYRARFVYPGRLFVYARYSGELIAKSRVGRPAVLAKR